MGDKSSLVFTINKNFTYSYKKIIKSIFKPTWKLSINLNDDLQIKKGFIAVLGESGSGKSTFVSILSGFEKLSREQAKQIIYFHDENKYFNYNSKEFPFFKKNVFGYIFQRCYESKSLNAIDNIAMPLVNRCYPRKTIQSYCKSLLNSLKLTHISSSSANELSGGQLTRIGILRGIAQTPRVLFADEPANNLDEQNAERILNILQSWQKQTNSTVIMVTHHLKHAFKYADQIIVFQSTDQYSGTIVCNKQKNNNWTDKDKQEINEFLTVSKNNQISFPSTPHKKYSDFTNKLLFLGKMAWTNIVSKADGSRSISMITLAAFILLFFTIFSGNLLVSWFYQIDKIKNNDAFLRRFEIKIFSGSLSKDVQQKINNIKVGSIRKWLISKNLNQVQQLKSQIKSLKIQKLHLIEDILLAHQKNQDKLNCPAKLNELIQKIKNFGYYISLLIKKNDPLHGYNRKDLYNIEQEVKSITRLINFMLDISNIPDNEKACEVYPRWGANPEFVYKNGKRRNLSTRIRWLDYRDPFFDDPRLKYIRGTGFRFESNEDEGVIIDMETLVDDLGYCVDDSEINIIYGGAEITCVPVRAVVESMPEKDSYHAITTIGFGEKIRSHAHHCDYNKRFYQCHLIFDNPYNKNDIQQIFNYSTNYIKGNIIYDYAFVSEKTLEIFADYEYALTQTGWTKWVNKNFADFSDQYQIFYDKKWEVPAPLLKEPPYSTGTVYTSNANIVRSLGAYLSSAFQEEENKKDRCQINVYGYEDKIQFSKQSQTLINWFRYIGFTIFVFMFIIFLVTDMMITIRSKASEIAIYQAMGGSIFGLLLIFNIQIFIIIISAICFAFYFTWLITPIIRNFFITYVIQSIWNSLYEQREAEAEIITDSISSTINLIFQSNIFILQFSFIVIVITVSTMILYVKYSPNYRVTKILKER